MEQDDSLLIRALGSSPKLRILDFFLDNKLNDFTKREILEALGMSKLTLYKYFSDLEELGLVIDTRKIGRATLYKVNLTNPMVKMLIEYEMQLSSKIAEEEAKKTTKPLAQVQRKMRDRLPAWSQLEGKADRLLIEEIGKSTKRHRAQHLR